MKKRKLILVIVFFLMCLIGVGIVYQNRSAVKDQAFRVQAYTKLLFHQDDEGKTKSILKHSREYSTSLLKLASVNQEALDFAYDYIEKQGTENAVLSEEEVTSTNPPLLLQWDERWGYVEYGNNMIGVNGCGPTCLSMVYVGLTHSGDYTPKEIAEYAISHGYYNESLGTVWTLFTDGAVNLGLKVEEIDINTDLVKQQLADGKLLICSMKPGDFTTTGHFIVLYDCNGDSISLNDPNSINNSSKTWDVTELVEQVKHIWAYSISVKGEIYD